MKLPNSLDKINNYCACCIDLKYRNIIEQYPHALHFLKLGLAGNYTKTYEEWLNFAYKVYCEFKFEQDKNTKKILLAVYGISYNSILDKVTRLKEANCYSNFLLKEIFGPTSYLPNNKLIKSLAKEFDKTLNLSIIGILADALEEYEIPYKIINHLRKPYHSKYCWVIRSILN